VTSESQARRAGLRLAALGGGPGPRRGGCGAARRRRLRRGAAAAAARAERLALVKLLGTLGPARATLRGPGRPERHPSRVRPGLDAELERRCAAVGGQPRAGRARGPATE
jgi:hypothetical protein